MLQPNFVTWTRVLNKADGRADGLPLTRPLSKDSRAHDGSVSASLVMELKKFIVRFGLVVVASLSQSCNRLRAEIEERFESFRNTGGRFSIAKSRER